MMYCSEIQYIYLFFYDLILKIKKVKKENNSFSNLEVSF